MRNFYNLVEASYRKDLKNLISYRLSFFGELFLGFFAIIFIIFISKLINGNENYYLSNYDGKYFLFLLTGASLILFVSRMFNSMPIFISQAQSLGYFENLVSTKRNIFLILLSSSFYPLVRALIRISLIFFLAIFFNNEPFSFLKYIEFILLLIVTSLPILGISLIVSSLVIFFKKVNFVNSIFLLGCTAFSGVIYPIEVMPKLFQIFSNLFPTTFSLKVIRGRIIEDLSYLELLFNLFIVIIFSVVLIIIGIISIKIAIHFSKKNGTLSHY